MQELKKEVIKSLSNDLKIGVYTRTFKEKIKLLDVILTNENLEKNKICSSDVFEGVSKGLSEALKEIE